MANIVKFEKAALAKMDGDTLVRKIDHGVRMAFRKVEDANAELDLAVKAREEYLGEDVMEIQRLTDAVKERRLAVRKHIQDIEEYVREQKELFQSKNLNPDRAYTEAIVPTGELLPNGKEMFRIVKRGEPLEEVEESDETHASVRNSHSFADRMGMGREERRGKYNDAHLLIEQSAASIDRSEVVPMGCACT